MKNRFFKNLWNAILVVLFCTTNFAYAKNPHLHTIKTIAVKYSIVIAAVVGFSILLCIGLSIYNRFFVSAHLKDKNLENASLKSPTDIDDAIRMFIAKNRLK